MVLTDVCYLRHPKCPSCGLQMETVGIPEHFASKTCNVLTAQRQHHRVTTSSAAIIRHYVQLYGVQGQLQVCGTV